MPAPGHQVPSHFEQPARAETDEHGAVIADLDGLARMELELPCENALDNDLTEKSRSPLYKMDKISF